MSPTDTPEPARDPGAMYHFFKRAIDFVVSLAGLTALSPLLVFVALIIKIDSPGPVFFRGTRVGRWGKPFHMLKFRTMREDQASYAGPSSAGDDDPRITRLGKFLRGSKINELPQLINVLKGDMSLVGPRPQVQWDVDLYTPQERKILEAPPGVTDYASIQYHNEGEILAGSTDPDGDYMILIRPGKLKLQLYYIEHRSLKNDLRIFVETVRMLLASRLGGAYVCGLPEIEQVLSQLPAPGREVARS